MLIHPDETVTDDRERGQDIAVGQLWGNGDARRSTTPHDR